MKTAYRFTLYLLILLSVLCFRLYAQPKFKVQSYGTERGLSHQSTTAILKDKEGFMWFGSWDGINRFDGQQFVTYKSFPGDRSQLENSRIDQVLEGQPGYLWLKAYNGDIYRFDKKTEQFLSVSAIIHEKQHRKIAFNRILSVSGKLVWLLSAHDGLFCVDQDTISAGHIFRYSRTANAGFRLPSDTVFSLYEDKEHSMWVNTAKGVCCLTRAASGYYKNSTLFSDALSGDTCTAIAEDKHCLYFSTTSGNLATFDKISNIVTIRRLTDSRINALWRSRYREALYATTRNGELIVLTLQDGKTTTRKVGGQESLHSLYEDRTGMLWIEPATIGAIRMNPADGSSEVYAPQHGEELGYIGNRFRVVEDNNNFLWINMKGGGFGYYNRASHAIEQYLYTTEGIKYPLPHVVFSTYYDKAGVLWLTTQEREVVKIISQPDLFQQQLLVANGVSRNENEVRGMIYDSRGRLWVGAKSGRLFVYSGNQGSEELFVNAPREGIGGVYTIMEDRHHNIWLGTKKNGLFKAIPLDTACSRYKLIHYYPDLPNSKGFTGTEIYSLLEDRYGRIWIGSFDQGLFLATAASGAIQFMPVRLTWKNNPHDFFYKIRHLALDSAGLLWIGTTNGLVILDASTSGIAGSRYRGYSKIPGDLHSLGANDVQFIFCDSKKRMWVATSGGGLAQVTGGQPFKDLQFKGYTRKDGMPNDYILSCADDKNGLLWIATENGLSRLDINSGLFRNYDSYDGLPRISFSEAAVVRNAGSGQIVFGTSKGLLQFDPAHLDKNRMDTRIVFTKLEVNSRDAGPGTDQAVLPEGINYTETLKLKHDQRIFSIDYTVLDARAGSQQGFYYRLLGFDSTWHNDQQLRRATYTNLPPGQYVFEVKGMNADLYSKTPYRRLEIVLLPPPWKTGWAYILYTLLAGVIIYFIRKYALTIIRLRQEIMVEQKLATLKTNFFTNISHELRTPLTLIVNPINRVLRKETLSQDSQSLLEIARKNTDRMIRFINQLLDLRKVQEGKATLNYMRIDMVSLVKRTADYFKEAFETKGIVLEIVTDKEECWCSLDADKIDMVIYNLLGNALKFAPERSRIRINIQSNITKGNISIAVSDQGPGVEKQDLEKIFDLFHGGEQKDAKGSGIGLSLSRELVALHNGRIYAANNPDAGLTVTVELPCSTHHQYEQSMATHSWRAAAEGNAAFQPSPLSSGSEALINETAPLVLLVEDNDELRDVISRELSDYYRIETAADGEAGLEKAKQLLPDLVVSDIMMPKIDGIRMLELLKNEPATSHIPVVLLTAKQSIESRIEGLQYGADAYITKPFNTELLIASVNSLLAQRKKMFEWLVQRKKKEEPALPQPVITARDETFLKELIAVVEAKMTDKDFNIEIVAETMALGRSTFYKKLKSLTGLTPVEFVRDIRLEQARVRLEQGNRNISDIAYECGFSSPAYFSTCFKEKYGVAPSGFIKSGTPL